MLGPETVKKGIPVIELREMEEEPRVQPPLGPSCLLVVESCSHHLEFESCGGHRNHPQCGRLRLGLGRFIGLSTFPSRDDEEEDDYGNDDDIDGARRNLNLLTTCLCFGFSWFCLALAGALRPEIRRPACLETTP